MRHLTLVLVLLTVVASCTGDDSGSSPTGSAAFSSSSGASVEYIDRSAGFSFRYPPGWHLDRFDGVCRIGVTGAMVSNVAGMYHDPTSNGGCYWPPHMDTLPPGGVVVMANVYFGGPASIGEQLFRNTPLPLTMDSLSAPNGPRRSIEVVFHHSNRYSVHVWMGDEVSDADETTAAEVLASISAWEPSETAPAYGSCMSGWERQEPGSVGSLGSSLDGTVIKRPSVG